MDFVIDTDAGTQLARELLALRGVVTAGRAYLTNCFAFTASFAQNTADQMLNNDHQPFLIRGYRSSDRETVRKLCCNTGFLGDPIDPDHFQFFTRPELTSLRREVLEKLTAA